MVFKERKAIQTYFTTKIPYFTKTTCQFIYCFISLCKQIIRSRIDKDLLRFHSCYFLFSAVTFDCTQVVFQTVEPYKNTGNLLVYLHNEHTRHTFLYLKKVSYRKLLPGTAASQPLL